MKKTALENCSIETFVSLDSGIRFEVLNVRESFACSEASIKRHVDLKSSVKVHAGRRHA